MTRFDRAFAAPSPRKYQKPAIEEVVKGIEDPNIDVVILNAPTGSGKSLILDAAANMVDGDTFFTTPLNALVDQLENDEFIRDRVITMKGRNNYECIHPEDAGTTVDKAICQRQSGFECEMKGSCEYYGRKERALHHPEVVTNMSYLMAEGMVPEFVEGTFGDRRLLIVDECQNIDDFAMGFISFTVSERTVPEDVWNNITLPDDDLEDDMDSLVEWLETELLSTVTGVMDALNDMALMSEDQTKEFDSLRQFKLRVENFLEDVEDNHWVAEFDVDFKKNRPNQRKVVFEPIKIGRFLRSLLWSKGEDIVLSSATVPGGDWLDEIGLGDSTVKRINVPSTFPVENRPILFNHGVGKMVSEYSDRSNNRKTNAWSMAQKIKQIAEYHKGKGEPNGFVHCRSYNIAELLKRSFSNHGEREWFSNNVMMQDRYNREESLEKWINSDVPVFFSVAMDEGIDLKGDKCHWQVLAKTLYPFMSKRVKKRKELEPDGFWDWYNLNAAIQIQQAYGRGVRSPDDECVFYVLDSSARKLVQMNAELFNKWFLEGIMDISINPERGV